MVPPEEITARSRERNAVWYCPLFGRLDLGELWEVWEAGGDECEEGNEHCCCKRVAEEEGW